MKAIHDIRVLCAGKYAAKFAEVLTRAGYSQPIVATTGKEAEIIMSKTPEGFDVLVIGSDLPASLNVLNLNDEGFLVTIVIHEVTPLLNLVVGDTIDGASSVLRFSEIELLPFDIERVFKVFEIGHTTMIEFDEWARSTFPEENAARYPGGQWIVYQAGKGIVHHSLFLSELPATLDHNQRIGFVSVPGHVFTTCPNKEQLFERKLD